MRLSGYKPFAKPLAEKKFGHQACTNNEGKWGKARHCRLLVDVGGQLQVPQCILVTAMRPDMMLYSECARIVYFIQLMIPFEDVPEEVLWRDSVSLHLSFQSEDRGLDVGIWKCYCNQ